MLLAHSSGVGNGNPLQDSCLANPMDRGAWKAAVHGVARSWTQLSDFTFTFLFHALEKEMAAHSSGVSNVFLPGESQGRGSLVGCHLWGRRVGHNWSDLAAAHSRCSSKMSSCPPFLSLENPGRETLYTNEQKAYELKYKPTFGSAPLLIYLHKGVLINEILNHMKSATQPSNRRKLIMYSAVSILSPFNICSSVWALSGGASTSSSSFPYQMFKIF